MKTRFCIGAVLPATAIMFPAGVSADHPSLTVLGGPAGPVTTLTATPVPVGTWTTGLRTGAGRSPSYSA